MSQKYKVFLNDRMIIIASKKNITFKKPYVNFNLNTTARDILKWFISFVNNDHEEAILIHPQPEKFFLLFRSVFKEIPAAGGVVLSDKKMMFIFRNGKWDLPKGKIEPGEKADQAAIREVEEECGIMGHKIEKQLPSTYHIYISPYKKTKGQWIFKETIWFEMQYSGHSAGRPQVKEGITKIKWFSYDELDSVLKNTYGNLKQIITTYHD